MKHLFIVNPIAGGRDATKEIRAKLKRVFESRSEPCEVYVTKAPMDATDKIKAEASSGEHLRVYACGGDGTFNECVNGAAQLPNVAVCPFPTGTGNDFCRTFGEEGQLYRDISAVVNGREQKIDLINCNGRWCANICSVGIDARVGADVHKYSNIPLIGGSGGYVISAIVNLFKGITRNMRIRSGEYSYAGAATLVCVCNGRFYGGGFNPSLKAMPNDGILDIIVARKTNLLQCITLIAGYAKGKVEKMSKIADVFRGTELTIELEENNVINLDGELLFAKTVHMKLVPNALNLIIPEGMSFFG